MHQHGVWTLTIADLCSLIHHGHFDGASIWEHEGQILSVGEHELFLPDAPELHRVDQGHLQPLTPPQSVRLGLT